MMMMMMMTKTTMMMRVSFPKSLVLVLAAVSVVFADRLQCKDPGGRPVDWFTAIKLPKLSSHLSDGTGYVYMDARDQRWTYLTGITTENSAVGHTVSQMYAPTESHNNTIMWVVYNDEPTNVSPSFTKGHSKGVVVADNGTGFWLVHSVPKFPHLPYQNNNTYSYPETGVKFGQSFLCMSMVAGELDKVGDQLITNEAVVYGSHFGAGLGSKYPAVYNATLPRGRPSKENDGVRLQRLQSIDGYKFLSISKNRNFGKDLYEDLITNMTQSNLYTETWLNSKDRFNSSCTGHFKTMNIKLLTMKDIKGLENCSYKSSEDHSKWVITGKQAVPWSCIGDINRAREQTHRGGGTVCIDSITIWSQYKKLVLEIENCKM